MSRRVAGRHWPDAAWIVGTGRYAVVAYCGVTTVTLHAAVDAALAAVEAIDRTGCGHACHRAHVVIDLQAGRLRRIDHRDVRLRQVREMLARQDRVDEAVSTTAPRTGSLVAFRVSDYRTVFEGVKDHLFLNPHATDDELAVVAATGWAAVAAVVP